MLQTCQNDQKNLNPHQASQSHGEQRTNGSLCRASGKGRRNPSGSRTSQNGGAGRTALVAIGDVSVRAPARAPFFQASAPARPVFPGFRRDAPGRTIVVWKALVSWAAPGRRGWAVPGRRATPGPISRLNLVILSGNAAFLFCIKVAGAISHKNNENWHQQNGNRLRYYKIEPNPMYIIHPLLLFRSLCPCPFLLPFRSPSSPQPHGSLVGPNRGRLKWEQPISGNSL